MINRILVAVDLTETEDPIPLEALGGARAIHARGGTGEAERLLAEALALARTLGASLEIAYVRRGRPHEGFDAPVNAELDEVDEWIDRELAKLGACAAAAGVPCTTTSLQGPLRRTLVSHVEKMSPDLLVVGGRRRWRGLARSANKLLLHGRQRVLVIPATRPDA